MVAVHPVRRDILFNHTLHVRRMQSVQRLLQELPRMIPVITKDARCEECYRMFTTWNYDESCVCTDCRSMKALERIAEAIETWIGWQ